MTAFRVHRRADTRTHIGRDGSRSARGGADAIINPAVVFASVVIIGRNQGIRLTAARTGAHIFHRVDTTRCSRPGVGYGERIEPLQATLCPSERVSNASA